MAVYLEELVRQGGGAVEIQRGALAARFGCAPSQVNYVLATRFTLDRGYVLESRPGQGGYIRVRFLSGLEWQLLMPETVRFGVQEGSASNDRRGAVEGMTLTQEEALGVTQELRQAGLITEREASMLRIMMNREVLGIPLPERDRLRARLVRAALVGLMPGESPAAHRRPPVGDPGAADSGKPVRTAHAKLQPREAGR